MSHRICPHCKEKNPFDAVMCRECSTYLPPLSRGWKAVARLGIRPYHQAVLEEQVRREERNGRERDPIARIFNTILRYGTKDGANEICIEPQETGVTIFYRIDGELQEQITVPRYILSPLVSHIKDVGKMETPDAGEAQQHGHIDFALDDRSYRWSVSTQATTFGEKVVLIAPA